MREAAAVMEDDLLLLALGLLLLREGDERPAVAPCSKSSSDTGKSFDENLEDSLIVVFLLCCADKAGC